MMPEAARAGDTSPSNSSRAAQASLLVNKLTREIHRISTYDVSPHLVVNLLTIVLCAAREGHRRSKVPVAMQQSEIATRFAYASIRRISTRAVGVIDLYSRYTRGARLRDA